MIKPMQEAVLSEILFFAGGHFIAENEIEAAAKIKLITPRKKGMAFNKLRKAMPSVIVAV